MFGKLAIAVIAGFLTVSTIAEAQYHVTRSKLKLQKNLFKGKEQAKKINIEMKEIQAYMDRLMPAISEGRWKEIEEVGKKIEKNFLLKNPKAKKEIYTGKLPDKFHQFDKEFHEAGRLIHLGAKKKNGHVVSANFARLVNTCMKCHARFAPYRFNQFIEYVVPEEMPKEYYSEPEFGTKPIR